MASSIMISHSGEKHNRLTILSTFKDPLLHLEMAKCQCSCGKYKNIILSRVIGNKVKSCGCLNRENVSKKNRRHGLSHMESYYIWLGMISRCFNVKHKSYANYGGRGIKVCDRWLNVANFIEDMGERPKGMSIDRINNDGNYEPGNCKWSTNEEQSNNSRKAKPFIFNGEKTTMSQLARKHGVNFYTLRGKIMDKGMSPEEALKSTKPWKKKP